jgi:hypothetical protein
MDNGRPLLSSAEFASCPWATGRLIRPGSGDAGWLHGFKDADHACGREFRKLTAAAAGDEQAIELRTAGHEVGRPIDVRMLTGFIASVTEGFGVAAGPQTRGHARDEQVGGTASSIRR